MSYITQKKISQIFRQDVMQKGFKHVSVAQIMHQVQIRRQSFYDNFDDKYDLLAWTIQATMEDIVDSNLDYLPWQEIISLVFFELQENAKFYKSVLKSQVEVDIVREIAWHIQILLLHILRKKGLIKNRQAYDFVETYCLGLTYTMTNNLFLPEPKEYDELAQKVCNAIEFAFGNY